MKGDLFETKPVNAPLQFRPYLKVEGLNLSENIIYVNCISCSILYVTPYVAREGDYAERCQTGCSLGNRVFCPTGLSAFKEAGEYSTEIKS